MAQYRTRLKVNYQTLILFALCFLFFALGTHRGFWEDELAILADVIYADSFFEMIHQLAFEVHAPGLYLLIYLLNKVSVNSEFALRIPSLLAASFGMIAFSKIADHYLKASWTFAFVLFCSALSAVHWHASEMRPHIFLFAFGSWILYFLHKACLNEENENFYLDVKKSIYLFTVSLFFHFATLFILLAFFLPFFFTYRKRFLASKDLFLGKSRFIIYPTLAILLAFAAYLFTENISSVLWSVRSGPVATVSFYVANSFGLISYFPAVFAAALASILISVFKNKLDVRLRYILILYVLSVVIFYVLALFGIPFGRPRYSLYLLPIPTLVIFVSISNFKFSKLFQTAFFALVATIAYINLTQPYYKMDLSPKIMIERADKLMRDNPQSRLVVIGDCRNLTYYFKRFQLSENENLVCLKEINYFDKWTFNDQRKNYVLIYMTSNFQPIIDNLKGKVILQGGRVMLLESYFIKDESL